MIGNKDIEEARAFGLTHAEFIAREYLKFRDGKQTKRADIAYAIGETERNAKRVIAGLLAKGAISRTCEYLHGGCVYVINKPAGGTKMSTVENVPTEGTKMSPQRGQKCPPVHIRKDKENIIIDDIKTQACACERTVFDLVFEWVYLTHANAELLLFRNGLLTGKETDEEKKAIARASTDEFTNIQLENGIDIEREGCRDTRIHFANWIRKRKKIQEDESSTTNRASNARKQNGGISTDRAAAIVAAGRELANITERMRNG